MHGPETRETRVLWRLRIAQKHEKTQAVHGPEPRENACIAEAANGLETREVAEVADDP